MNKYEILEQKLKKILEYIYIIEVNEESTKKYLQQYANYVDQLIVAVHNKKVNVSNGALLGLIRGISDYDELCSNDELWSLVCEADNYYCVDCKESF